jgi:predicted RNA binding protein YcfA (HicA-like mRNA interferase family)
MGRRYRPLTCREVKTILKNLGFEPREQRGSHQHWVRDHRGVRHKVTVDCPKEPFTGDLLRWMIRQAGVSKDEFYAALDQ